MKVNNKLSCTSLSLLAALGISQMLASCATSPPPRPKVSQPISATQPQAQPEEPTAVTFGAIQAPEVVVQQTDINLQEREAPAKALIDKGRYLDAALLLSQLAESAPSPQRQDYQLQIASLLLQGNYLYQAEQILAEIIVEDLPFEFQIRKTLMAAQLELAQQRPQQALQVMAAIGSNIGSASIDMQQEFYNKRIDAFTMMGDYLGTAQARTSLNLIIENDEQILESQEILLRDLQKLEINKLQALQDEPFDDVMRGWIALSLIAKSVGDEQQAQQLVYQWREQYSDHPVKESILNTIIAKQPEALGRPTQVAVILPNKGRFAKAAAAIRKGLLAGYYDPLNLGYRPNLRFYDEGTEADQVIQVYERAVSDGANFVVGPLQKDSVTTLSQYENLSIPVLGLNYGDLTAESTISNNFFQISLSPEQEAKSIAEHAWLDGHLKAAAIIPTGSWGTRVYEAFKARWEELGGEVVEIQNYDPRKKDYGKPIKKLLNIDESEKRFRQIKQLSPVKLLTEPRRRKDVQMIFMAAFARQGRLIRPQLRFHHASDIPVYATSHVYTGTLSPDMDRDMNDVKFSDMPWTLTHEEGDTQVKRKLSGLWPRESKRYMRLYALGLDSFNLIPRFNRLRRNRFSSFQGKTGLLYLDINNRLLRRLVWAQFISGKPQILDKF